MKPVLALGALSLALSSLSQPVAAESGFPEGFLIGRYHLIGQAPDAGRAYAGQLTISQGKAGLAVTREIDGKAVKGTGEIVKALCCEGVDLLRIRFAEPGADYEETCMVASDLDNYARVTCYLYRRDSSTERPGFEALFVDLSED